MLAGHATGLTRIELYTCFDKPLSENERAVLRQSIQRRLKGEPLQYIIGRVGFRHLELTVRPPVLIPRPETELLVELAIASIKGTMRGQEDGSLMAHTVLSENRPPDKLHSRILDIGTGTGAIALALLSELPGCQVFATDIDETAIILASENARELELDGECLLHFCKDDLASSFLNDETYHGYFDLVVSNPPYVPSTEYEQLPAEILQFESRLALDGGMDGLEVFRRLAEQAAVLLKPGSFLTVELHEHTLEEAAAYARNLPYCQIQVHKDLAERNRFLTAVRK